MGKQSIETFKNVVEATPDISSGYRGGLQALGTNSKKINAPDMRLIGGGAWISTVAQRTCIQRNRVGIMLSIITERCFM